MALINGTNTNDLLIGTSTADLINGFRGSDTIRGGDGDDTIRGGLSNDFLFGGTGNDLLYGDSDNDFLFGGIGNDSLSGGSGFDTAVVRTSFNVSVTNTNIDDGMGYDSIISIERVNVYGDGNDQSLNASSFIGFVYMRAGGGNDYLYGGSNNDTLLGGNDNDNLFGGAGNDVLNGGNGDDTADIRTNNDVSVSNTQIVGLGTDSIISIERVNVTGDSADQTMSASGFSGRVRFEGEDGNDTLYGSAGDDTLYGGFDDDLLEGDAGSDEMRGESGNDTLNGGDGADWLYGDFGDDVLVGGLGQDTLSGNLSDRDIFVYNDIAEGGDLITDFQNSGSGQDSFRIAASGFAPAGGASGLVAGQVSSSRIVVFTDNLGSSAGFRYNQSNGELFFDSDGGSQFSGLSLLATVQRGGAAVDGNEIKNSIFVV